MNLSTISRLPDDIAAPPLGAPINRPQTKPADPGHWVPAATPGYLLHTGTRTMSREQDVPVSERPTKPAPGLYLESGEFVPAEQINAQPAKVGIAISAGPTDDTMSVTMNGVTSIVKAEPRDDGPCGVVPSVEDLQFAWTKFNHETRDRKQMRYEVFLQCAAICGVSAAKAPGWSIFSAPADRRADVIKALNKLGN